MTDSTWKNITPEHLSFQTLDHSHVVTTLKFDNEKIVTGSDSGKVHIYDIRNGSLQATLSGHEGGVWALQYTGNTLISASTDRTIRVWDIAKAECTHILHGHTSTARCLEILQPSQSLGSPLLGSTEQPVIISGSRDTSSRIWKLPESGGERYLPSSESQKEQECPYLLHVLAGHTHSVRTIAAYGDTLVSGSYDTSVRAWRISTGAELHKFDGHDFKVYSVALDTKRGRCISGAMDKLVKIWCLETGALLYNLEGHTSLVGLLSMKEDQLVTASADGTLRIWDAETGECQGELNQHTGAITSFDHDDEKIISGSDRMLKLWNAKTASFEKDLLTGLSSVWQVRFDEQRCVTAIQRNAINYIEVSIPIDREMDFG